MHIRIRSTVFVLCALALLVGGLGGCGLWYGVGKTTGLIAPEPFVVRPTMPEDFSLGVAVRDAFDPATDYSLRFERNGRVDYHVTVRTPRRKEQQGTFEITEDQVVSLWNAVKQSQFDEIDDRFPGSGDGSDKKAGVQTYYVFADNTERRVEAHFTTVPALEAIRKTALGLIPSEVITASGAPGALPDRPKEYIGDTQSKRFHLPSCPGLKDLPTDRRHVFASGHDALNFSFVPCLECDPLKTK